MTNSSTGSSSYRRPSACIGGFSVFAAGLVLFLCGCADDGKPFMPAPGLTSRLIFNNEGNRLNAYDALGGFAKQTVIHSRAEDPGGYDVNGQICFMPDGSRRFFVAEDTGQPAVTQGWSLFQLRGNHIGALSADHVSKLVPTFQTSISNNEPYGCAFLSDGRLLTTDVGNQADGPPNGQLILWFPPLDTTPGRFCKLDTTIGTAGSIWVDDQDRGYVASARGEPGIYRYTGLPTSDDAAGGCGQLDATGAPLADDVQREVFIRQDGSIPTPSGIVGSPAGTFYVSSVFNAVIAEYGADGTFIRRILQRPPGDNMAPFSTGTPFGMGIDSDGTLYYADLGLLISIDNIGPGDGLGSVRRIQFEGGDPLPFETLDAGLDFPDAIAVLEE
jgi:hypothetical protein